MQRRLVFTAIGDIFDFNFAEDLSLLSKHLLARIFLIVKRLQLVFIVISFIFFYFEYVALRISF